MRGLREEEEELSAVKNPLSMLEKSLSLWTESDEDELVSEPLETLRMSGALRAWTLVVERNSVGREILARLMVPGAYLTVQDRGRGFSSPRVCARARLVKLRTRDMASSVAKCSRRTDCGRSMDIDTGRCSCDRAFARWFRVLFRLVNQWFVALNCCFMTRRVCSLQGVVTNKMGWSLEGRYGSAGVRTQSEGADCAKLIEGEFSGRSRRKVKEWLP